MDDDFDIDHKDKNVDNKHSINLTLNSSGKNDKDLCHLKILGSRFKKEGNGKSKAVDIRKGVSIEKTLRMKDDGKGGFT